jgi:hypothetical protein
LERYKIRKVERLVFDLESPLTSQLFYAGILAVGALFIVAVLRLQRSVEGDVARELKLRGLEPSPDEAEVEPEEHDEDFVNEELSDTVTLAIHEQLPMPLKPSCDLRAIVDDLGMAEFVILSRGHFHFIQAVYEADGFLMEMRQGRDHFQAEWQSRYGERSPYFDNDAVAETLLAYVEKRPMLEEIIWEPI